MVPLALALIFGLLYLTVAGTGLFGLYLSRSLPPRLTTRGEEVIYERIWGYDFGTSSNSLDVYIGYLRRKTESDGGARLIHTVRGVGYALRES